jgi:hypothetical protein
MDKTLHGLPQYICLWNLVLSKKFTELYKILVLYTRMTCNLACVVGPCHESRESGAQDRHYEHFSLFNKNNDRLPVGAFPSVQQEK